MYLALTLTKYDIIFAGIFGLFIYYVYQMYLKRPPDRITKYVEKMPGQKRFPIVGTSYVILFVDREDFFNFMKQRFTLYYGMFRNWIGNVPSVNLSKPEHAEVILNNSIQINKSAVYDYIKPWLGEGLLTSSGSRWQTHRKLLTPAFHFKILENSLDTFDVKSRLLVEQLRNIPHKQIFDISPYITHCTLDIICETAMGIQLNSMDNQNTDYVNALNTVSNICMQRIIKPWLQPEFIFKYTKLGKRFQESLKVLHDFTIKMINERRSILNNALTPTAIEDKTLHDVNIRSCKGKTFLDILLEAGKSGLVLSDEDIRQEVDTFLFEGHDTTSVAICWSLFLLGNHWEIQDRVHKEISDALKDHEGAISMDLLGRLKLLERCIKEAMRLYPSVPIVSRVLQKDVEIDGYLVPTGCTVHLYIFMVHRDLRYYDNPEEFNPDRFLPENIKKQHPYAYIPFSGGPRNCIGQKYAMLEIKVILAHILKNFKVKSVETEEMVRPMMELVLRPLKGVRILLEVRN